MCVSLSQSFFSHPEDISGILFVKLLPAGLICQPQRQGGPSISPPPSVSCGRCGTELLNVFLILYGELSFNNETQGEAERDLQCLKDLQSVALAMPGNQKALHHYLNIPQSAPDQTTNWILGWALRSFCLLTCLTENPTLFHQEIG